MLHLQIERLIPDRIEVTVDGLGSFLGFAHLHCYIGITGASFILGLQALGTENCGKQWIYNAAECIILQIKMSGSKK